MFQGASEDKTFKYSQSHGLILAFSNATVSTHALASFFILVKKKTQNSLRETAYIVYLSPVLKYYWRMAPHFYKGRCCIDLIHFSSLISNYIHPET